jgi:hypothetical protein
MFFFHKCLQSILSICFVFTFFFYIFLLQMFLSARRPSSHSPPSSLYIKAAHIMESSCVTTCKPNDVPTGTELANELCDCEAVRCLPPGFTLQKTKRDKDCMFSALALCRHVGANTPNEARESIFNHIRDLADCKKDPIAIQTFMDDVHRHYLIKANYWGDDCKSLLTTLGLNMNAEAIVVPASLSTFRTILSDDLLPNVMKFLFGETMESYRKRILNPMSGRGDYPELVAAGQIWHQHIIVMYPVPSHSIMAQTCIIHHPYPYPITIPIPHTTTIYLVCVNNNHYHACEFSKDLQVDTMARLLLPSRFYVEQMKRDRDCMFRALAHLWKRDTKLHDTVRNAVVHHIACSVGQPWWTIQCS